jgi:tetratricopeptide (TPR) repeat protein
VNRIVTLCCCFLLVTGVVCAQSLEKRAIKNIRKAKWESAAKYLTKALVRDSASVLAYYGWGLYYFQKSNPSYDVERAYASVTNALDKFVELSGKDRQKISRFPIDSLTVVKLREDIDSVAFTIARAQNSEEAYVSFLKEHPYSSERKTAEQLRNAVAYLDAVNQNTYQAFKTFLEKYPDANERNDARSRYERLLFEKKTRDRRLASFEAFLKEYPETPFRREIERDIFELFTLSGEVERFMSYLKLYPQSPFQKLATNILFHILMEGDDQAPSGIVLSDSLEKVMTISQGYLVPFLKQGKFGLMNNKGFEVISAKLAEMPDEYLCGNITEDILVFSDRVVNRIGSQVFSGLIEEIDDLGSGFLKIKTPQCLSVVHKSGFVVDSCVVDAKMIDKRFIAVKDGRGWTIRSLTARPVTSEAWDDVNLFGGVIALKKDQKQVLLTFKQLADVAHEHEFVATNVVDQLRLLPNGMIWISSNGNEAVYDQSLKEVVPLDDYKIESFFDGFIIRSPEGFSISDNIGNKSSYFESVQVKEPLLIVRKEGKEYLFNASEGKFASPAYDSISVVGTFLKGIVNDSTFLQFTETRRAFSSTIRTQFIAGKDSVSYLLVEGEGKKTVFNPDGIVLFSAPATSFESIQHAGGDYFIISKKEKKGLIDSGGKIVLPIEHDAIGTLTNNTISVLKSMNFGLLNVLTRKLIKPQYDKNIVNYKSDLLVAFRNGKQGFIDWDNKPKTKFELDEVKYWTDSIALVRKDKVWAMLDLSTGSIVLNDIKEILPVRESADEKLYIMNQNNLFGVMSSLRGKIIPFSFSDVVNVGSTDDPLYFTEKHVSEASVFVVIYYDKNGKMLRREVYEDTDEYEKIYCQQN